MSEAEREELLPLFEAHLPKTIADLAFDRVQDAVPKQYVINAIASHIASKMVYKGEFIFTVMYSYLDLLRSFIVINPNNVEGCEYIDSLPQEKLMDIAFKYIAKEKEVASLKEILADSNIPENEKELMLQILEKSGVRTALAITTQN